MTTKITDDLLCDLTSIELRRALFYWLDGLSGKTESEIELMAQYIDRVSTALEATLVAIPQRKAGDISRAQRNEDIADHAYNEAKQLTFIERGTI
jgi:hypothetical protein